MRLKLTLSFRALPVFVSVPVTALVTAALALWLTTPAVAQSDNAKIWAGVFSAAQADRGKAKFEETCARCHHVQLTGSDRAPSLMGESFLSHWDNETVGSLFLKVRDQMPPIETGVQLEPADKLDIVSYILRSNNFPVGRDELTLDVDQLDDIQIVSKGAKRSVANFALVQVVGCLTRAADETWTLTKTSPPVVTRDRGWTPRVDVGDAGEQSLGEDTYRLMSTARFKPDAYRGQKVEARGLLYRTPSRNLLDLTSLRAVSSSCVR